MKIISRFVLPKSHFSRWYSSLLFETKKLFNPAHITYIRLLLVKLLRFSNISDGLEILEKHTGHFTVMDFIISVVMFWALFIHFLPKFWSLSPYFRLMHWPPDSCGVPWTSEKGRGSSMFCKAHKQLKKNKLKGYNLHDYCYWIKQKKHCKETVTLHLVVNESSSQTQRMCCGLWSSSVWWISRVPSSSWKK